MTQSDLAAKFQKQWKARENQFRTEKALLEQQMEFLKDELREFQQRDQENRKLNESIIMTYKNNEQSRNQNISKTNKELLVKHAQEMEQLKNSHAQEIKKLEAEVSELKEKVEKSQLGSQQTKLDSERRIVEIKKQLEHEYSLKREEDEKEFRRRINSLQNKLKKAESTIRLYKDYLERVGYTNSTLYNEDRSQINLLQYSFLLQSGDNQEPRKSLAPRERHTASNILAQEELGASVRQSRLEKPAESILNFLNNNHNTTQNLTQIREAQAVISNQTNQEVTHNRRNSIYEVGRQSSYGNLARRERSQSILQTIQSSQTKSKKYLLANKENIDQLTSRISRAVSSLEEAKSKSGIEAKKVQHLKERIQRKLRTGF